MLAVRRALFGVAGGFAITDMYVNAVRISDVYTDPPKPKPPQSTGLSLMDNVVRRLTAAVSVPPPPTSLPEDVENALSRHRVAGTLIVGTLIFSGGVWSMVGSGAAIVFDGEDGAGRYTAVKEWLQR